MNIQRELMDENNGLRAGRSDGIWNTAQPAWTGEAISSHPVNLAMIFLPQASRHTAGFTSTVNLKIPKKQSTVKHRGWKTLLKRSWPPVWSVAFNFWSFRALVDGYWLCSLHSFPRWCCCYGSDALIYHQLKRNRRERFGRDSWAWLYSGLELW